MEKIKERSLLYLWLPQVLVVPAALLGALLALIPVLGWILGGVLLIAPILFGIVYNFYFYYQLSLDVDAVCEGDGYQSKSYLYVLALNSITFGIYGKYWIYMMAKRLQANAPRYGFKMMIGGREMVVLDIFSAGWISAWEFVRNMNKFAKVYNQQGLPAFKGGVQ